MVNPKSLDNLQSFDTMDSEKHKELSRRGGLASAAARRELREQKEMMTAIMKYGSAFATFSKIWAMSPKKFERLMIQAAKDKDITL